MKYLRMPQRGYLLIAGLTLGLGAYYLFPWVKPALALLAILGALPTFRRALGSLKKLRINIDVFNTFALGISLALWQISSTAFIGLMLQFAELLDWYTESRTKNVIQELLKLKPLKATKEIDDKLIEVPVQSVQVGDILVIENGSRVPVDGIVVYGKAEMNEASVSGESAPIEKVIGDVVLSSTLNESGVIKIKATRVGKDSTIERMAELMREAATHKSQPERIADKFAEIFLPIVAVSGLLTYLITKNIMMTAALFLVACADDMAVAVPLAITASMGQAAKRGVIIKGGKWFDALSKLRVLVLDKTGTLTYGRLSVESVSIEPGVPVHDFWRLVAISEKFSEHPAGHAVFRESAKRFERVPDPDDFRVYEGTGVWVKAGKDEAAIGNEGIFQKCGLKYEVPKKIRDGLDSKQSTFFVIINKKFAGSISVADVPRKEAAQSVKDLKLAGIKKVIMFTGDRPAVAKDISDKLGIDEFHASMAPEEKYKALEELLKKEKNVGMVGDGINDAPALALAPVGIAMGQSGTAVAVEAADVVILNDKLSRLPEMVLLGRRTISVIHSDIVIWLLSNLIGFTLVFGGWAGPAFAAFYNFATDFFPLLNSSRLFYKRGKNISMLK